MKTLVVGLIAKRAVWLRLPRVVIWVPMLPSLLPMASMSTHSCQSSSSRFTSLVHITPEEMMKRPESRA